MLKSNVPDSKLSYDELLEINDSTLNYIKSLSLDEIYKRIEPIIVGDLHSPENLNRAKKLLNDSGVFIVPNFLTGEYHHALCEDTEAAFKIINDFLSKADDYYEDEGLVIQRDGKPISGYSNMANYNKPVINQRAGQDKGMIDVFNFDYLPFMGDSQLKNHLLESGLQNILNWKKDGDFSLSNINLYRNHGVIKTRGFHLDDFDHTLKAFVYLSDVESLEDGPYCYCKGTHVSSSFRKANQVVSSACPNITETPIVPLEAITPLLAKSGTLIVSNQTGFHRGIPQKSSGKRQLIVTRFR